MAGPSPAKTKLGSNFLRLAAARVSPGSLARAGEG
jgi:hypothetical protein